MREQQLSPSLGTQCLPTSGTKQMRMEGWNKQMGGGALCVFVVGISKKPKSNHFGYKVKDTSSLLEGLIASYVFLCKCVVGSVIGDSHWIFNRATTVAYPTTTRGVYYTTKRSQKESW